MKRVVWIVLAMAVATIFGMVVINLIVDDGPARPADDAGLAHERLPIPRTTEVAAAVPLFSAGFIDDSGYDLGVFYTPAIKDRSSLVEVASAHRERAKRVQSAPSRETGRDGPAPSP